MTNEDRSPYDDYEEGPQKSPFQIKSLLLAVLTRWHWLLLGLLVGLGIGFFQAWRAVPLYQARATVLVKDYSVSVLNTVDAADFDLRNSAALETVRVGMMTYQLCERIASDPNIRSLEGIVPPPPKNLFEGKKEVSPDSVEVPPSPQLAGMIRSWLSVDLLEGSRLMSVNVQHPDPVVAAAISNAVIDEYIKQRGEVRAKDRSDSFDLLEAQADRLKDELSKSKARLTIYENPIKYELALVNAEQEFDTLQLKYRAKHPDYQEAKRKVELAEAKLKDSLRRVVANPTDAAYWNGQRVLVEGFDEEGGFENLREKLIERRAQLETEIESQQNISETLLSQAEKTKVNQAQNEAEIVPYEKARPSRNAVTKGKASLITTGTLAGLMGGFALALLFSFLDNKFHTVDDLEQKVPLPVLAVIPRMDKKMLTSIKGKVIPGREDWDSTLIFSRDETQTILAESFRVLRAAVSLLGPADERKTTLVTSALPSEGKTTVASNLACAMAEQGLKTILVDFDLRKPSVHKAFGRQKDEQKGAVDVLSGNAELSDAIITETGLKNLHFLLSGSKSPSPGELLQQNYLGKLLASLVEQYDHVVIDSAPVLAVADSRLIAPLVANFCFVVRADETPKGAVERALEILSSAGKTPSGTVFNFFQEGRVGGAKKYNYGYYRAGKYTYGSYGSDA